MKGINGILVIWGVSFFSMGLLTNLDILDSGTMGKEIQVSMFYLLGFMVVFTQMICLHITKTLKERGDK